VPKKSIKYDLKTPVIVKAPKDKYPIIVTKDRIIMSYYVNGQRKRKVIIHGKKLTKEQALKKMELIKNKLLSN
jgi:hypothetical protein